MKIFLSWSGKRSQNTAKALKPWLKGVIQSADPWISVDMERGTKWLEEISKSLNERTIGIFCVTPGNAKAPWLMFEAGAMSRHLGDEGRVIPYLLDFRTPGDLEPPLGQFNACVANEEGTWQLIKTLNSHSENKLDDDTLRQQFDLWWPKLAPQLEQIRASGKTTQPAKRSDSEKLDELLTMVRSLERTEKPELLDLDVATNEFTREQRRAAIRHIRAAATELGLEVARISYSASLHRLTLNLISTSPEMNPTLDAAMMSSIAKFFPEVRTVRWVNESDDDEN